MPNKAVQKQLTVRITVEGGVIQNIICPPGVEVIVRDYDVEGAESIVCPRTRLATIASKLTTRPKKVDGSIPHEHRE